MQGHTETFGRRLDYGQVVESAVARYLIQKGYSILPVYETMDAKGPRLMIENRPLVAPDMLAWAGHRVAWVEAKHKWGFSYHHTTRQWTCGIDLRHYLDYCIFAEAGPWPVWLFVVSEGKRTKGSPEGSPKGLYAHTLRHLSQHEHHRHPGGGRVSEPMVYWSVTTFNRLEDECPEPEKAPGF